MENFLVYLCVIFIHLSQVVVEATAEPKNSIYVGENNDSNFTVDFENCFALSRPIHYFIHNQPLNPPSDTNISTFPKESGKYFAREEYLDIGRRTVWLSRPCKQTRSNFTRESNVDTDDQVTISLCIRLGQDGNSLETRDWTWKWIQIPIGKYCIKKSLEEQQEYENQHKGRYIEEEENGDDAFGLICSEYFDEPKEIWASATTIRIVLGTLVTLTSLCFVVIFVMHVRDWHQQGLPGWLTIGLVTTMFVLHVIKGPEHVFGTTTNPQLNKPSLYCVLTGISIHFLHLSSFSWLTVLSFDIWSTFRRTNLKAQTSKSIKRFLAYVLFAFGFPSIVVGIGLFLDKFYGNADCASNIITPKYGSGLCYLQPPALAPYLMHPVSILIVPNIIFFASTAYHLKKHQSSSSIARENISKNNEQFILNIKLAFTMGIPWSCAMLAAIFNYGVIWTIGMILCILQPVSIFVIFLSKGEMKQALRNRIQCLKK